MEELNAIWSDGSEEELVRELLDNESPFFVLPDITEPEPSPASSAPVTDCLLPKVYSGPTIEDIECALSITNRTTESNDPSNISRTGISLLGKGLSKSDHKYTLKIKGHGDRMPNDGYKWRKYGRKSIKNNPNPRSYYRCTNPRCSAKKQVERSNEDPDTLVIAYEGLHLHFAYSHFLLTPPIKKSKTTTAQAHQAGQIQENVEAQVREESPSPVGPTSRNPVVIGPQHELYEGMGPQGLLEDVVPMVIRNPWINNTLSNSSCSCSYPSSPPTSSSSSLSCSPTYSSFDFANITSFM